MNHGSHIEDGFEFRKSNARTAIVRLIQSNI
jgi:hypothetical protein